MDAGGGLLFNDDNIDIENRLFRRNNIASFDTIVIIIYTKILIKAMCVAMMKVIVQQNGLKMIFAVNILSLKILKRIIKWKENLEKVNMEIVYI